MQCLYSDYLWSTCERYDVYTAQKMKFYIKDFFSKCDQIRSFLENLIFRAVLVIIAILKVWVSTFCLALLLVILVKVKSKIPTKTKY